MGSQHPFSSPPTGSMWFSKHTQPKIEFINKKSDDPSPFKLPTTCSSTCLEKTLSRAYNLRISGKGVEAVGLLMDLMDDKYGTLRKVDKLKVHDTFSSITNELGWLF